MSNNKQTIVEWLFEQLEKKGDAWETPSIKNIQFNLDVSEYLALKQQAKAMHKDEKIKFATDFFFWWYNQTSGTNTYEAVEQYYNETFNND